VAAFRSNEPYQNRTELRARFRAIEQQAEFYFKLGEVGMEADVIDYELTFERFKRAVLISGHARARAQISAISDQLRQPDAAPGTMGNHRQRLRETISHFLTLLA
jgi:hypothetical protein